jgi:predicted phage terminase large subunit-like protein
VSAAEFIPVRHDHAHFVPRLTKYIPHIPHLKQRVALIVNRREVLFGGAGGGGKSDYLLMGALQYVDCPKYAAIIFRRNYPQLRQPGGLIPRAMEWLEDTDATGAEKDSGYFTRWDFPRGASLNFGHMQHFSDHQNQQGGEYQFVGIDELGQFREKMITYMFSRLRRLEGSKIPTRLRATANPGGEGHEFIVERFGIPPAVVEDPIWHENGDRVFIPSKLDDNPSIDREDYRQNLAHLDPIARAQIERGDWSAREAGDMFDRDWWTIVDRPLESDERVRFWDLAATKPRKLGDDPDYSVGTLMSVSGTGSDRVWTIEDVIRFRENPAETRKRVRLAAEADGQEVTVGIEEEGSSSGKIASDAMRKDLVGYRVKTPRSTGDKAARATPLASAAEAGMVQVVRGPWLTSWLAEFDVFPTPGTHDDQIDSASGAYSLLYAEYEASIAF